jgi:hypothetical protein
MTSFPSGKNIKLLNNQCLKWNEVEERDAEDFRGAFAELFQSPEGRFVDHI